MGPQSGNPYGIIDFTLFLEKQVRALGEVEAQLTRYVSQERRQFQTLWWPVSVDREQVADQTVNQMPDYKAVFVFNRPQYRLQTHWSKYIIFKISAFTVLIVGL